MTFARGRLIFVCCSVWLFALCGCRHSGTWVDGQIDPAIRASIRELDAQVIRYISTKDTAKLKAMFSDSLWDRVGPNFASQVEKNEVTFDTAAFKEKNQFYIVYTGSRAHTTVHRGKGNEHDYILTFQPMTEETAVTLGYFNASPESFALTTSFGKYGNTWKLNILEIGLLKIMNGDAVDWYHRAKRDYDSGYLADAANDLLIGEQLLRPAGDLLHYEKEKEISDLDQHLSASITQRYPFPMTDSLVQTKPSIFRISVYRAADGYYPFVLYRTKLPFSDTLALAKECDAVYAHLNQLFRGLDEGKRYLYFRAYSQIPGDTTKAMAYKEFRREGKPPYQRAGPPLEKP
jgi:hypothetical protein